MKILFFAAIASPKKERFDRKTGQTFAPSSAEQNIESLVNLEGYSLGCPPAQDSSHHQDYYIFSRGSL